MGICNMGCYQYIESKEINNLSCQISFSKNKNKSKLTQIIPTTHSEILINNNENSLSDTNIKNKENPLVLKNKKAFNDNYFDNFNHEEDIINLIKIILRIKHIIKIL